MKPTALGRNVVVNLRGFIKSKTNLVTLESSEDVSGDMPLEKIVEKSEEDDAGSKDVVG